MTAARHRRNCAGRCVCGHSRFLAELDEPSISAVLRAVASGEVQFITSPYLLGSDSSALAAALQRLCASPGQ
jgi:hypothetical protein